jgi:hypothetical protein
MRFERRGGAPDMQAAFKHLIEAHLRGRSLDDNQSSEASRGRFPDFGCFRDIVMIEMKHLESDQSDRLNSVIDELADPNEKPVFYASRDFSLVSGKLSNADEINSIIGNKLSRTIENVLSSANKQFTSYRNRNPRKNTVNICVILNSKLREFTPNVVIHAIHRKMKQNDTAKPRFPAIDAVLYFSEKHATMLPNGRIAFATAIYECLGALSNPWKMIFVDRVVEAWFMLRTGDGSVEGTDLQGFDVMHDIPERMSRSDMWYLEYQRNPYLKDISEERLRVLFHRNIAISSINLMKGDWPKLAQERLMENMRQFTHIIEETNRRGIDLRNFSPKQLTPEQRTEVYQGLPAGLVALLTDPASETE